MTYGIEMGDNKVMKNSLRTAEMKVLRKVLGLTLRNRRRIEEMRWGRNRRRSWNAHVESMEEGKITKIVKDGTPGENHGHGHRPHRRQTNWKIQTTGLKYGEKEEKHRL